MKTLYIMLGFACLVVFALFLVVTPIKAATVCQDGNCFNVACVNNGDCGESRFVGFQSCQGNGVYQNYQTYTCNNPGTQQASCTISSILTLQTTCQANQICNYGVCTSNPATTNTQTTYVPPSAQPTGVGYCTPYATKKCVSNISYWYNSCGALEAVAQNCNNTNQVCQSGVCVNKAPVARPSPTTPGYVKHFRQQCSNNSVYWYDSRGLANDIAKSCDDKNSCTQDSCGDLKCSNTLKCDGSTCAAGSADFMQYCPIVPGTPGANTGASLSITIFGKKNAQNLEWTKSVNVINNDEINILLTIKNTSTAPIDNVSVRVDALDKIDYTGNLKVDNAAFSGNIAAGIDMGTIAPKTSKVVSFTGKVKPDAGQNVVQINTTVTANGVSDSDYVIVNIQAPEVKNNFAAALGNSPFVNFLKTYWLWIIVTLVLIGLFVVIFRRLSSNV